MALLGDRDELRDGWGRDDAGVTTEPELPAAGLRRRAENGAVWVALESLGYRAANLVAFVVISRLVTKSELGLAAVITVIAGTFTTLNEQGRGQTIIRNRTVDQRHLSTTFWRCATNGVILTTLSFVSAPWVAEAFGGGRPLVPLLRLGSFVFVVRALEVVPSALSQRAFNFKQLALRKTVAVVTGAAVGIVLAVEGFGAYAIVWQLLVFSTVSTVALGVQLRWVPDLVYDRQLLRDDRHLVYPLMGVSLLRVAQANLDTLLVGLLLGNEVALALYTVAGKALGVVEDLSSNALRRVALPVFVRLQNTGDGRFGAAMLRMSRVIMATATYAFLMLAALATPFTRLVFGAKFEGAAEITAILSVGAALESPAFIGDGVLIAANLQRMALYLSIGSVATTLVLVPSVGHLGLVAVACAVSGREVLMTPLRVRSMCRATGTPVRVWLHEAGASLAPAVAGSGAAYALTSTLGTHVPALVCLVLGALVGLGVMAVLLRVLARPTFDDLAGLVLRLAGRVVPGKLAPAGLTRR